MGLKPQFLLFANRLDVSAVIAERLISLRYTDCAGAESDVLEVTIADHDPLRPVLVPPVGAELELFLGYDNQLSRMGLFVFDELEIAGWPGEMVIRARAAPFAESKGGKVHLQTQKTRAWAAGVTLGAMASKIASEHGLKAATASSLAAIVLPHFAQSDESDLHFLARIARRYDAIVKPASGKLVVAKKGETKSVSGQQLPPIILGPQEVSSFRLVRSRRETAGSVVAYYHAIKEAKRHEVKIGAGEPVTRLRMYFPTQEMALAAARSELDRRERGAVTVSLALPGRPEIAAEAELVLAGFRDGVAGSWLITRVEHSLDAAGYACSVEAELPNQSITPDAAVEVE